MNFQSLFLAGILAVVFYGCEKEQALTETFKVKFIAGMCGQNIIEILDSNYYDKGINWTNTNGQSFKNVFSVQNHCDFELANLKAGDVFNCRLIAGPGKRGCTVCMAYMEIPPKAWNVKVVK